MSNFFALQMASSAMRSFQFAMMTTSHNISNVNTPGYSRQTVTFGERNPWEIHARRSFFVGSGIETTGIARVRDMFLQQRSVQVGSDESRFASLSANLKLAQASFGDLSSTSGISNQLDNFFNSFQALSANPSDIGLRAAVKSAADALATKFRSLNMDLTNQQSNLTTALTGRLSDLNEMAAQVADINHQIVEAQASGGVPNDLADARDQLIGQMSKLADVRTSLQPNGAMMVFVEQHTLVDQSSADPLGTTLDLTNGTVDAGGQAIKITGGEIGGAFDSIKKLASYQSDLHTLAGQLINQVNNAHSSGYALDGTTGHDLFAGTDASTFDLSADVKASAQNVAAGATANAGDGNIALTIANMAATPLAGLGNRTFNQYYVNLVTTVGTDVKSADAAVAAQTGIRQQVDAQIQANSGVNLDEEMTNLLQYQRAYEASARVLTIMDSLIEETLNTFGR